MAIIKARPNRVRSVRHQCHLQEPNRDTLVLYARFIGDTVDYVLNQLIETTLVKDRDFVVWRQAHPDEVVMRTSRPHVRPAPSDAPTETRVKGA
jgi:hypothetical protein